MTRDEMSALRGIVADIKAEVAATGAKVETFQQNWREQDRRAMEGRKTLYERVEGYARNVQDLAHKVSIVAEDIKEMKPAVEDWKVSKNRAEGAFMSAKVFWLAIGAIIASAGWLFQHFLSIVAVK
jgi:hypothetical protein